VPIGVVLFFYESRPNVTSDAAALCLKSGNAVILRGGSAAADTNRATVAVLRASLERQGLPADAVGLLEGGHGAVRALMTARGLVDLLIPRGGADLIQTVVTESTVPVIETGVGNCHVYVDRAADLDKALAITVNSKTHRPSVCNAAESLLVHRDIAAAFLPKALAALSGEGVTLHTDADAGAQADTAGVAHDAVTDEDFATEFHGLELAVGVVGDEALPVVEAIPEGGDRYDFEARYEIGRTRFVCPAELGAEEERAVTDVALATYRALGCTGFARIDLILGDEGPWLLEANAIPGLTDTSLLPQAAEAAGLSFEQLVERILDLALHPSAA